MLHCIIIPLEQRNYEFNDKEIINVIWVLFNEKYFNDEIRFLAFKIRYGDTECSLTEKNP